MKTFIINIIKNGENKKFEFPLESDSPVTLLDALIASGDAAKHISSPCGGKGRCGKCIVKASSAGILPPDDREISILGEERIRAGERLSCLAVLDANADTAEVTLLSNNADADICIDGVRAEFPLSPMAEWVPIALSEPDLDVPVPAEKNLKDALSEKGIETKEIAFSVLSACADRILCGKKDPYLLMAADCAADIADELYPVYGIAVDIGTTTMAFYLCDLTNGAKGALDTYACPNPQSFAGADVISRIQYADSQESLDSLKHAVYGAFAEASAYFREKHGIPESRIVVLSIAGNTVMEHIFFGISPKSIATAPFAAASLFGECFRADRLGTNFIHTVGISREAVIYTAPCVASYVGGDITVGAAAAGLFEKLGTHLYIDIGTNGEMGIVRDGKFVFCATAAGPAFEGSHISRGMSGVPGAIRRVELCGDALKLDVIGGGDPVGICGSGIIDAAAVFLEIGLIDESGCLLCRDEAEENEKIAPYGIYADEDGEYLVLNPGAADEIRLMGSDVREIQLAKAAISAGIATLLDYCGIAEENIDSVVLAGGFGSHIDPASACKIGLIPGSLLSKITAAGNTAGAGAMLTMLSREARAAAERIANSTYLELSGNVFFSDAFIDGMGF